MQISFITYFSARALRAPRGTSLSSTHDVVKRRTQHSQLRHSKALAQHPGAQGVATKLAERQVELKMDQLYR
eukprot:3041889-Pleurochrysis_carterae.AAC.1